MPTGEVDDLITLSAQDAINLKYFKIKKLANKYEAEQAYILLVNVESKNEKINLSIEVYDGFSQEVIFSSDIENIKLIILTIILMYLQILLLIILMICG